MQFPLTFHIVCHDGLQNKCNATQIHKASTASKKKKKKSFSIGKFQFLGVLVMENEVKPEKNKSTELERT